MALKKSVLTQSGVNAEYWKTNDVVISFKEGQMSVSLTGYLTEEARDSSSNPVGSKGVSLVIGDSHTGRSTSLVPFLSEEIVSAFHTALYKALKTTPEFKDAEDV